MVQQNQYLKLTPVSVDAMLHPQTIALTAIIPKLETFLAEWVDV
jgi:hypothetical protein